MKKLLAILAVVILPVVASASEIKPGTIQVSGATKLNFDSVSWKVDGTKVADITMFGVDGAALYYITPMIGVGLDLRFENQSVKPVGGTSESTSAYSIGPKAGLDYPLGENLAAFADVALLLSKADFGGVEGSGFGFGIAGGVKYFPVSVLSLDAGLRYSYQSLKLDDGFDTKASIGDFGVFAGVSLYFGH